MLWNGPAQALLTVILAHGAGAPMDSGFMNFVAEALGDTGVRVGRFEFPYMAERRRSGKIKPPDRATVLIDTWRKAVVGHDPARLVIGGKSMGGRIASMVADDLNVAGVVCLGYPFFGMGRKDKPRIAHLEHLKTPALICQGERDPLGNRESVQGLKLSKKIRIAWAADGDHDLKPRKISGRTHDQNLNEALAAISDFLKRIA